MKKSTLFLTFFLIIVAAAITIISANSFKSDVGHYPSSNVSGNKEKFQERFQFPSSNNACINAIVTNIWTENSSTLKNLQEHNIHYLVVDIGTTRSNGKLGTPLKDIQEFLNLVHSFENESHYNFIVLPYSEINTKHYELGSNNSDFVANFISDYTAFSAMGFDGIFVDIEPVQFDQRQTYIQILDMLRAKLPDSAIISVYSGNLGDSSNEWEWDAQFYQEVSRHADIIVLPGYDIGLTDERDYKDHIQEQIINISSMNLTTDLLFGIPTHKQSPETINHALDAYALALDNLTTSPFRGVSIFSEWTIKQTDWITFEKYLDISNATACISLPNVTEMIP